MACSPPVAPGPASRGHTGRNSVRIPGCAAGIDASESSLSVGPACAPQNQHDTVTGPILRQDPTPSGCSADCGGAGLRLGPPLQGGGADHGGLPGRPPDAHRRRQPRGRRPRRHPSQCALSQCCMYRVVAIESTFSTCPVPIMLVFSLMPVPPCEAPHSSWPPGIQRRDWDDRGACAACRHDFSPQSGRFTPQDVSSRGRQLLGPLKAVNPAASAQEQPPKRSQGAALPFRGPVLDVNKFSAGQATRKEAATEPWPAGESETRSCLPGLQGTSCGCRPSGNG